MATIINYNGSTLGTVEAGQTATIKCGDKGLKSNIEVVFGSNGKIIYKDTTTQVEGGQTATILCANKKITSNIVISMDEPITYISGTYLVNNTVDFSMLDETYIENINGSVVNSYNYPFDKIKISPSYKAVYVYVTKTNYYEYMSLYSDEYGWSFSTSAFKFGDTPQPVTLKFYEWLSANTTKSS